MNEFEKRINALRLQFKVEQRQITKDANRTIVRLNAAIRMVDSQEAREALRAAKERTYETMRRSHEINRTCYLQQLELISDEQLRHHKHNPSNSQLRRMLAHLCASAEAKGQSSFSINFGNNRHCELTFN